MELFFDDADMDGQLQRSVSAAYSGSADVGEVLAVAARITPGDYDSWWQEWSALAETSDRAAAAARQAGHTVSATKAFLRATEYWRQAWFFLRHDLDDERLQSGWRRHRASFRAATELWPHATTWLRVPFEGVHMEGYLVRPADDDVARPTVIAPCGYDSAAEAGWAATGYMALSRGWNFAVMEGPGQGGMLYEHRVPIRPDFEVPFAAMLDDLVGRPGVDPDRLALVGRSFGGYLAPRAAAFEPRIAALVCDPGQVEFTSRMATQMGDELTAKVLAGDPETDASLQDMLEGPRNTEYWGARMATHGQGTFAGMLRELHRFDITDIAGRITCPTLITEGEGDFASQSTQLRALLTGDVTLVHFDIASGAGGHCEGLGATLFEQATFDWLEDRLGHAP
ncbi:alpha/beta hydrolase family protein [Rhabdothermincola salaria]|uniref:alpha/beta hydrolase family protein n=1 Tax=Rhabdothermincola salaria TaxID=2903142 RepID=UPI001E51319C|nr:alpha/beta hydrolase [Rhabdothermincola salaria]MCD9623998.1 acetylxylan esterase [Rhabdothermincola salaria]